MILHYGLIYLLLADIKLCINNLSVPVLVVSWQQERRAAARLPGFFAPLEAVVEG